MTLWNNFDNFTMLPWPILTIVPYGYGLRNIFGCRCSLQMEIFSWKNHLRFFDNLPPLLLTKVDNCTLWPWLYEFSGKKFDDCTLRIFDNFTPWILDNFPLYVIWQFSVSPNWISLKSEERWKMNEIFKTNSLESMNIGDFLIPQQYSIDIA